LSGKRGNGRDKAPSVREDAQEPPVAAPSEEAGADPGEGALTAVEDEAPAEAPPLSERETLRRERDTLREQLLRRRAEFENYRKRVERDRSQAGFEAAASLLRELVPTVDNLERALASGAGEETLRQGVELTYRELLAFLESQGVRVHDPVGQPFDPLIHQALMHEAVPGVPEGTVVEVLRKGYAYKDRLLRPALVKVAKPLEPGDETDGDGGIH